MFLKIRLRIMKSEDAQLALNTKKNGTERKKKSLNRIYFNGNNSMPEFICCYRINHIDVKYLYGINRNSLSIVGKKRCHFE